ncbi:MAG: LuxR C-terminal-related transcriptional regulator [Dermatophilaceae bacterium]
MAIGDSRLAREAAAIAALADVVGADVVGAEGADSAVGAERPDSADCAECPHDVEGTDHPRRAEAMPLWLICAAVLEAAWGIADEATGPDADGLGESSNENLWETLLLAEVSLTRQALQESEERARMVVERSQPRSAVRDCALLLVARAGVLQNKPATSVAREARIRAQARSDLVLGAWAMGLEAISVLLEGDCATAAQIVEQSITQPWPDADADAHASAVAGELGHGAEYLARGAGVVRQMAGLLTGIPTPPTPWPHPRQLEALRASPLYAVLRARERDAGRRLRLGSPAADAPEPRLTARQMEIVERLADGATDRQIARALGLSERTVHTHVRAILTALDVPNRASIVSSAIAPSARGSARAGGGVGPAIAAEGADAGGGPDASAGAGTGRGCGIGPGPSSGAGSGVASGAGLGVAPGVAHGAGSGVWSGVAQGAGSGAGSGVAQGAGSGVGSGAGSGVGSGVAHGAGSGVAQGAGSGVGSGAGSGFGAGVGAVPSVGDLTNVLTEAQRRVGELAAMGRSNRGIAAALGISERTVEKHLRQVLERTGTANRAALAARFGPSPR